MSIAQPHEPPGMKYGICKLNEQNIYGCWEPRGRVQTQAHNDRRRR